MTAIFDNMGAQPSVQLPPQAAPKTDVKVEQAVAASTVEKQDTVELSSKEPKEKKGLFASFKSGIASIKKAFASIGAYASGTVKGIKNALVGGSIIYTGGTIINAVRTKKVAKLGEEAAKKVKTLPAKALAIATAAIAFGASLFNAHLNANEAGANIDHRWTGHDK